VAALASLLLAPTRVFQIGNQLAKLAWHGVPARS
jgi:hypothetical protein